MKKKIVLIPLITIAGLIIFALLLTKILLGDLSRLTPHSGELLGFNQPQKHLLLFQNNNELRPNGGFISAYGILETKNGKLNLEFADSYKLLTDVDYPKAPTPFYILLNNTNFKGWYFHDSNFNPNFATSAKKIEELFWLQSGEENQSFDSIIAINFELLEDLVEIYNLEIEGVKLTKDNLFSVLEYEVKNIDTHNIEDLENRKNILGILAKTLIKKMTTSFTNYNNLFDTINKGLDQKKLLLHFKNEEIQKIVEEEGWAGEFNQEDYKNYIHTSIANIGGRKSDRYIKKDHKYFITFDENEKAKVKYELSLNHYGSYNLNSSTYKAYVRIFIPKESTFIKSEGEFYENRHKYLTNEGFFKGYIKMEPGETKKITIEYYLPEEINQTNFELDVIKQPGTKDIWNMIVQYSANNSFKSEGFDVKENVGYWSGLLLQDIHFNFDHIKDNLPPLVVWQTFSDHNLIEINFSEPLNEDIFLDPTNYKITDLNYIDNSTETISVEKVYYENNNVYLVTNGISETQEERYNLSLINLEDKSGNKTKPSTLDLTLVKRLEE
jgi:hypothetical protein